MNPISRLALAVRHSRRLRAILLSVGLLAGSAAVSVIAADSASAVDWCGAAGTSVVKPYRVSGTFSFNIACGHATNSTFLGQVNVVYVRACTVLYGTSYSGWGWSTGMGYNLAENSIPDGLALRTCVFHDSNFFTPFGWSASITS